jgi:hypothetical protein
MKEVNYGLSDRVREVAATKYVLPALTEGRTSFSIAVRDLMEDLKGTGFPARNWPQICTAIQSAKFLRAHGLEIEGVDGPPSKQSTTVLVRYRLAARANTAQPRGADALTKPVMPVEETPEQRAHRLTGKLRGLLKDEIAAFGGAEGFMRWVRGDDEREADEDAA